MTKTARLIIGLLGLVAITIGIRIITLPPEGPWFRLVMVLGFTCGLCTGVALLTAAIANINIFEGKKK